MAEDGRAQGRLLWKPAWLGVRRGSRLPCRCSPPLRACDRELAGGQAWAGGLLSARDMVCSLWRVLSPDPLQGSLVPLPLQPERSARGLPSAGRGRLVGSRLPCP